MSARPTADVLAWLADVHRSPNTPAVLQELIDAGTDLLAGELTPLRRALVLDHRARLAANLGVRLDGGTELHADSLAAGQAFTDLGLGYIAASCFVQSAAFALRRGDVSTALDHVVRGVLASQVAAAGDAAAPGEVGSPSIGELDPELSFLQPWASRASIEARIHNQLGVIAYELLAYDQAARLYRSGLDAAVDNGAERQSVFLMHNLAEALTLRASLPDDALGPDEREELLLQALEAAREVADGGYGSTWETVDGPRLVADVLCHLGRAAQAWDLLSQVEATHGRDPQEGQAPMLRMVRGRCLRLLGRPVEATIELDAAVTALDALGPGTERVLARLERSRVLRDAGDLEGAWQDAKAVATATWATHRSQVRGLFDLVWSRAGFEGERRRLEVLAETLTQVSLVDPLTGLLNRRGTEQALGDVDPLGTVAVLVVDVDYFKTVNDRYGHVVGDEVLSTIARTIREVVADAAVVARWGGEEFLVVLRPPPSEPGSVGTDRDTMTTSGRRTAEQVRAAVAALGVGGPDPLGVRTTVSIGVAVGRCRWWREVRASADAAMFRAKRAGRDRVVVA